MAIPGPGLGVLIYQDARQRYGRRALLEIIGRAPDGAVLVRLRHPERAAEFEDRERRRRRLARLGVEVTER